MIYFILIVIVLVLIIFRMADPDLPYSKEDLSLGKAKNVIAGDVLHVARAAKIGARRLVRAIIHIPIGIARALWGTIRAVFGAGVAATHTMDDILTFSNPIIRKELRVLLRSRRAHMMLLLLSLGISGYFLIIWQRDAVNVELSTRSQISRMMFTTLYMIQICSLGLISPVLTATVVTTERENKTLELLYCTGFTRFQILIAKWFSAIVYQFVLMVGLLPVIALTFQLGGVGGDEYLAAAIMITVTVAAYGMVGMAFSAYCRRTTTALVGAVVAVLLISLMIPIYKIFNLTETRAYSTMLSDSRFLGDVVGQLFVFAVAASIAWQGLARQESIAPILPKAVIKDQTIIEQRRKQWPYYLIDPLARAQEIKDNENPIYIKEQRVGFWTKLTVLIRLTYVGMFISFVLVVMSNLEGSFRNMTQIALGAISLVMIFIPVLAATGISKEREENTLDLLRVSLLEPRRIVWGKFFVALRFVAALALSMLILPIVMYSSFYYHHAPGLGRLISFSAPTVAALKMIPFLLGFSVLYTSVGLVCSSLCKRNVVAIVSTYIVLIALVASPYLMSFIENLLTGSNSTGGTILQSIAGGLRWYICPLVSPFFYFDGIPTPDVSFYQGAAFHPELHYFSHWENWDQIIKHSALQIGLSWVLVESAARSIKADLKK